MIVSDGRIVGDFGKVCLLARLLNRFAGITFTTVYRTDGDRAKRHRRVDARQDLPDYRTCCPAIR